MFFRWLRLYASRQPLILKIAVFWLGGLVFGFFWAPLLALAQALFSLAFLFLPTPRPALSYRLFLLVFSFAILRAAFSPGSVPDTTWWQTHAGKDVSLVGRVKTAPRPRGKNVELRLTDLSDPLVRQPVPGEVMVILPLSANYFAGQPIAVQGKLPEEPNPGQSTSVSGVTGAVFGRLDYPRLLKVSRPPFSLESFFSLQRQRLVDLLAAYLPEPEASLAAGVVLGRKMSLTDRFGEGLRRTGLMHVVVVSGYNISILVFFMANLTRFLGKKLNFFLTVALAVLYAQLAGGGWPVWRAVSMASFVLFAKVHGREREVLSALFFSVAILTLLTPRSLLDLSFQLSFLATLGLLLLSEPLVSWLSIIWPRRLRSKTLEEGLATTLSAQIATLPVLVYNFGQISLVAPLTNFLVFAVIPYLMWLSLALLLAALAAPVLAPAFAALAYLPLTYFVRLVGFFGQFSWALLRF